MRGHDLWWAAGLALFTGQRLGDVIGMLWSDFQGGLIGVTQNKTGKKLLDSDARPAQARAERHPAPKREHSNK